MKLILALLFLFASHAKAEDLSKALHEAQFYFLIDADTKEVFLSKNADARIAPSSMTKIMTAYVVFDQIQRGKISLNSQCLIGRDAWHKSGSSMFLNYGDVVSIDSLVKGLLAVSGNDASIALAESTAGTHFREIRRSYRMCLRTGGNDIVMYTSSCINELMGIRCYLPTTNTNVPTLKRIATDACRNARSQWNGNCTVISLSHA